MRIILSMSVKKVLFVVLFYFSLELLNNIDLYIHICLHAHTCSRLVSVV